MSTYRDAGVDIGAGNRAVELIKPLAESTQGPEVLAGVGPFSGLFALNIRRYQQPVLVASTDGVGTKVLLASEAGRHAQIGADLVNHCVDDVLTAGADPLFFLDYVATSVLDPPVVAELVARMANACPQGNSAALLAPPPSYLAPVRLLREAVTIKGLAHITGGGIVGNLPRILPLGLGARLQRGSWPEPPIFSYLAPFIADDEMWRTFNMGIGMIVVVDESSVETALRVLDGEIFQVGDIVASEQRRVQILE